MYTLYERGNFTMQDVENNFGSNLCRCTGYRSILTAFKTLAVDADKKILGECPDIEEYSASKGRCFENCNRVCNKAIMPPISSVSGNSSWFEVYSINEIFDVLRRIPNSTYMLIAGNTARGRYDNYVCDAYKQH